jgi:hypothetical protein
MRIENAIAFKEWAAVCAALVSGRQTIVIRKGGIHEGSEGFRVAHREFWFFPTYLHEAADGLCDEGLPLLEQAEHARRDDGRHVIQAYGEVTDVFEIRDEARLVSLAGEHIWSHRALHERFHYRHPGVFVLVMRVHALPEPFVLPDLPHFAGCRSWVDLAAPFPTGNLAPVLHEEAFAARRARVVAALEPGATV